MYPPAFEAANAAAPVRALLGSPLRFYGQGEAVQSITPGGTPTLPPAPYAVWQFIGGSPYNHLTGRWKVGRFRAQINAYGKTASEARDVADALVDAFEGSAYVVGFNGESRDATTRNYRYSFDCEWHVKRAP